MDKKCVNILCELTECVIYPYNCANKDCANFFRAILYKFVLSFKEIKTKTVEDVKKAAEEATA